MAGACLLQTHCRQQPWLGHSGVHCHSGRVKRAAWCSCGADPILALWLLLALRSGMTVNAKHRAGLGLHGSESQWSFPWLGLASCKHIAGSSPGLATLVSTVTQAGLSALPGAHLGAGLVA